MLKSLIIFQFLILTIFCIQTPSCPEGEYLSTKQTPSKCYPCQSHCLICTSADDCIKCQDRYFYYSQGKTCELQTLIKTDNCVDVIEKDVNPPVCKTCANNYWLALNKSCIQSQLIYCKTFAADKTIETCDQLKDGYDKPENTIINCTKIHEKCYNCTSEKSGDCKKCSNDYFLTTSGTCSLKTQNCKQWKVSDTEECSQCEAGYSIHPIIKNCYASQCLNQICGQSKARTSSPACNVSCHANDPKCIDCTSVDEHTCKLCATGYQLLDGACYNASAQIQNCKEINSTTSCKYCITNYTPLNSGALCQVNIAGCAIMANENTCSECKIGYYLIDATKICGNCKDNCTCIEATSGAAGEKCSGCQEGYWKNANSCDKCNDVQCITCANGINLCTQCKSGYTVINNVCVKNIDNCQTMKDQTQCSQCQAGYALTDSKLCILLQNCKAMLDQTHCSQCNDGYWANSTTGSCTKCIANNCKTCAVGGKTCSECLTGYNLDTTKNAQDAVCVLCSIQNSTFIKLSCNSTQRIEFPWTCTNLTNNCIQNDNTPFIGEANQNCINCDSGYKLANGNCVNCSDTNCHDCSDEVGKCKECKFGYHFNDSNQCIKCQDTCLKCKTDSIIGTCLDCQNNYTFYTGEGEDYTKCQTCIDNCLRCSMNATCIQCSNGYYLNNQNTQCLKCSTNCTDCDINTTCYSCSEGSYLNKTKCTSCFDSCKSCENGDYCIKCIEGYELNGKKTSCIEQSFTGRECLSITNCSKCSQKDTSVCVMCKSGSAPEKNGKCSCTEGLLLGGKCVVQEEKLPDDLEGKTMEQLKGYVTAALSASTKDDKAKNTKNILAKIKNIIKAEGGNTNDNAANALQLLIQFADTATYSDAETSYKEILQTSCNVGDLSQENFQIAFAAADKYLKTSNDSKAVYDIGFSTCLINLLKKGSENIVDISPLVLSNSELTIQKFNKVNGQKDFYLSGISIQANQNFLKAIGDGDHFITIQAINKDANPFKNESNNNITLSSKIVSFSVMTSGSNAQKLNISLNNGEIFPIKFNAAENSDKCGYYNTISKKWIEDGAINVKEMTCSFSHLTEFAIFTIKTENSVEIKAQIKQIFMIILIFIIILF